MNTHIRSATELPGHVFNISLIDCLWVPLAALPLYKGVFMIVHAFLSYFLDRVGDLD